MSMLKPAYKLKVIKHKPHAFHRNIVVIRRIYPIRRSKLVASILLLPNHFSYKKSLQLCSVYLQREEDLNGKDGNILPTMQFII